MIDEKRQSRNSWIISVILTTILVIAAIVALSNRFREIEEQPPFPPTATRTATATFSAPTRPPTLEPTNTPLPIKTVIIPNTPTPIPTVTPSPDSPPLDTPVATVTPNLPPSRCAGVQGGYLRRIFPGDTLWDIWLNEVCGVSWPVWLKATLEDNWWLTNPDRIHPTGAHGWALWMPFFEAGNRIDSERN